MISAFSTMISLILGLIKRDEKSNEITVIPELLNIVDIKGKIITTDAMGCQKKIEVKLHWCLDVAMREHDCRIRRGNAAELLSGIRHVAINILAENKGFKAGLMRKMRRVAMDREYLASVLARGGVSSSCPVEFGDRLSDHL